jgi:hypothetical protein
MTSYRPDELRPFLSPLSLEGPIEPFLVLADWLQEREDPWGKLIAVDAALEADASERAPAKTALEKEREAILAQHGAEICGLHRSAGARLVYRRGFVASAALGDGAGIDANELSRRLASLLSSPAAALIERLDASESRLADPHAKAFIAERERLARIHVDLRGNLFSSVMVDQLRKSLPHVDVSRQKEPDRPAPSYFAESGSEHRAFIRLHGGARSIDDIDD